MTYKTDIATINTCIDLLNQHRKLHFLSCLVTTIGLITWVSLLVIDQLTTELKIFISIALILGLIETLLAIRIKFDQALFTRITDSGDDINEALLSLDQSLTKLRLIKPDKTNRSLDTRLNGCLTLLKKQIAVCCAQITFIALIIWIT